MTLSDKNKYIAVAILAAVFVLGTILHLFNIQYPDRPVFDEAHFATYAGDYATHQQFDDIHPPLGKLIYAAVLSFYPPERLAQHSFLKLNVLLGGKIGIVAMDIPYGNFPYVPLRVVSAIFGILLPIVFYYFLRNIGAGRVAASLGAIFILLDNALLIDTRLIFMDGMFMLFSLAGLALYFKKNKFVIAGGVLWGLALAIKLTAIIFIGPVIIAYFLASTDKEKKIAARNTGIRFTVVGFLVLLAISFAGTFYFPTSARLNELSTLGFLKPGDPSLTAQWQEAHPVRAYFLADAGETLFSVANYVVGDNHDGESPWYFWPAGQSALTFYSPYPGDTGGSLLLVGNPVLWLGATFAVIVALAFGLRYLKDRRAGKTHRDTLLILLGGYAICMVPFITFVKRSTFLYHYFPALIFAFGLLGWSVAYWLKLEDWTGITRHKRFILAAILLAVVIGFIGIAPFTFGLR